MESEVIKKFNAELTSIHDSKVPSKAKINDITKAALKAKSLYKHVVFSIERFLTKCKPEHRLSVLYIIDSIIRTSKHQFKERDVFAPRFLKCFDKILKTLINCKPAEQLKVVRTLNLWLANNVYTREEIEPFRIQCSNAGIQTDFEKVEKAVKGSDANMRRYDGSYDKKQHHKKENQTSSTTPPGPPARDGLMGAAPGIPHPNIIEPPRFEPTEDLLDGVISQKEMLNLIRQAGFDKFGFFEKDPELLSRAHNALVGNVKTRMLMTINQAKYAKASSIKNVLTKDFEYSDDEDEKEKEHEPEDVTDLPHEQVLEMATELMKNETVHDALLHMIQEKHALFNQPPPVQLRPPMSGSGPPGVPTSQPAFSMVNLAGQPNLAALSNLPPGIAASLNPQLLQNAQLNPVLQQAIQQGRLAGLPPPPNAALNLAHLQALQNVPPNQRNMLGLSNLLGNPLLGQLNQMNLPQGIGLAGLGAPPNSGQPNGAGLDQMGKQIQLPSMGVPPPFVPTNNSVNQQLQKLKEEEDARRQMAMLQNEEKTKEQEEATRQEGRSRDKSAKRDRERSRDRERKKIGLPSLKSGITYIASRTLWLKKVPANCSDNDLKVAVEPCGESRGIRIIANRACAYVTMETRKAAYDVVNRLKEVTVAKKTVKVYWARGPGMNEDMFTEMWDIDRGILAVPHDKLPKDLEKLCEGSLLDLDSLPESKRNSYDENGASKTVANPPPAAPAPSNIPANLPPGVPPPSFPFPMPGHIARGPMPPGLPPPMFNKRPPPPNPMIPMPNAMMPVPPPPGVGRGQFPPMQPPPGMPAGFDMNRPPPMHAYDNPPPPGTAPPMLPPSPYGRGAPLPGNGTVPNNGPPGAPSYGRGAPGAGPPPSFRGRGGFEGGMMRRGGYEGGRGGFDGGFDGGRGGGHRNEGPPMRGRYGDEEGGRGQHGGHGGRGEWHDERRRGDNGRDNNGPERWHSRERERSESDRRRHDDDGGRRRSSRWARDEGGDDRREDRYARERRTSSDRDREKDRGERDKERDRERSHRRDREHSGERRSNRDSRKTPTYEEEENKARIEVPPVEGVPAPMETKNGTINNADDEIVSSTTLDDIRPMSVKDSETGEVASNSDVIPEKAIVELNSAEPVKILEDVTTKMEESVVVEHNNHAESMEEVPMDLE